MARLVAVVVLVALAALRFHGELTSKRSGTDEQRYLRAFELEAQGQSQYQQEDYFYPPALGTIGGALRKATNAATMKAVLRALYLMGLVLSAWLAAGFARLSVRWRAAVAAGLILAAPPFAEAMDLGNLSPLAAGLTFLALTLIPTRPITAGLWLALAIVLKPLAIPMLPLLFLKRGHDRRAATVAGIVTVAILTAQLSQVMALLQQVQGHPRATANVSLHRLLILVGATLPPAAIQIAVTVVAMPLVRRIRAEDMNVFLLAVSLLAFPIVWNHTMVYALPVILTATATAIRSLRAAEAGNPRNAAWARWIGITAAAIAVLESNDFLGTTDIPRVAQAALLAIPVLATPALAWSVLRSRPAPAKA